jgi:hypothetical protein
MHVLVHLPLCSSTPAHSRSIQHGTKILDKLFFLLSIALGQLAQELASPDFHKATVFSKDDGGVVGASRRALDHAGMDRSPPSSYPPSSVRPSPSHPFFFSWRTCVCRCVCMYVSCVCMDACMYE